MTNSLDVLQRKRLSEQLRIEKELFPKCIQAPMKYENKRKSSLKINENIMTLLPGEEVSAPADMASNTNYVQQWLNKNDTNLTRKPFSDLNVNTSWGCKSKSKPSKPGVTENIVLPTNRKRTLVKTIDKCYLSKGENSTNKQVKKQSVSSVMNKKSNAKILKKCANDESGIFMEDEPILICDSQETLIDKDKNAWLAVVQACENESVKSSSLVNLCQASFPNDENKQLTHSIATEAKLPSTLRVPFYKRSAIVETCEYCKNEVKLKKSVPVKNQEISVNIIKDGGSYSTTISVLNSVQSNLLMKKKNTVSVQTDICETTASNNDTEIPNSAHNDVVEMFDEPVKAWDEYKNSEDLFADDKKIFNMWKCAEVSKCVVIQESDSDTDLDASGPMSVRADVHRSNEELEYGILTEVVNVRDHESKLRHAPRGHTPTSTDSSEKENYNPNRIKTHFIGKKKNKRK